MTIKEDNDKELSLIFKSIVDIQNKSFSIDKSFKYIPETDLNGKGTYEIHEYRGSKSRGYIIYQRVDNWIKKTNYGNQEDSHDWIEVENLKGDI